TDKATMEVEAVDEGTLGKIVVPGGTEGVKVNEVIAYILEEGEDASAISQPAAAKGDGAPAAGTADAKPTPAAKLEEKPAASAAPQKAAAPAAGGAESGERVIASPLAKRMAAQAGIDLSGIKGSGPHGRIVRADIEGVVGRGKPAPAAAPTAATAAG